MSAIDQELAFVEFHPSSHLNPLLPPLKGRPLSVKRLRHHLCQEVETQTQYPSQAVGFVLSTSCFQLKN
jgi:hypothetical protein